MAVQLNKMFSLLKNMRLSSRKSLNHRLDVTDTHIDSSLDLIFDLVRERISNQQERLDSLDTKANFAIGASTGLVSAGLVLQSLLLPHSYAACSALIPYFLHILALPLKRAIPLLPLLIAYLAVMITALYSYKPRKMQRGPNPNNLIMYYLYQSPENTKEKLLKDIKEAFSGNELVVAKKGILVNLSFIMLVIESVALVLLLLSQTICAKI